MTETVSVYVTFGSGEEAARIGRDMVERRLAACVNILGPCRSIYRWQGEVEEAAEVAAIFKAGAESARQLVAAIVEAHSYEQPAVVVLPHSGAGPGFREWIEAETL